MTSRDRRSFRIGEIAERIGATLEGSPDAVVSGVCGIEDAAEGDLTFVARAKFAPALATTRASAVILPEGVERREGLAVLRAADPYAAMMRAVALFDPGPPPVPPGVHPTAIVSPNARLADDVRIGPGAVVEAGAEIGAGSTLAPHVYVGENARLGESCYLYPGVYVGWGCRLGDRVMVQPGAVIGSDGFGYAPVEGSYRKIPQIGIVDVGDDVEIGANSSIDRATFGKTSIGQGTKIDNLVHVAHNVAIAEGCAIAALSGIAGSTKIGRGVRLGGQAGIVGHLRIGDGVSVAARAGVIKDVPDGETVSGYPARPHREQLRVQASLRRIPQLHRRIQALESERESDPEE